METNKNGIKETKRIAIFEESPVCISQTIWNFIWLMARTKVKDKVHIKIKDSCIIEIQPFDPHLYPFHRLPSASC